MKDRSLPVGRSEGGGPELRGWVVLPGQCEREACVPHSQSMRGEGVGSVRPMNALLECTWTSAKLR
jgi:hypothetical protein